MIADIYSKPFESRIYVIFVFFRGQNSEALATKEHKDLKSEI
jgi:hypothetical protein